jgi:hypothetical protein
MGIPLFLSNYEKGYVISIDLEVVLKTDIAKSSLIQKFLYWIKGTFEAKKTAVVIDKFMKDYLENGHLSKDSVEDLKKIQSKLKVLHEKFASQKGVKTLEKTLIKVAEAIERLEKEMHLSATKPSDASRLLPTTTSEAGQFPEISLKLAGQLKTIQDKINTLNPQVKDFKKIAAEIKASLQELANTHSEFKNCLSPLIDIMKILESKGSLAFKLDYIQASLIEKFNPSVSPNKSNPQVPLRKLLDFLKTFSQTSSPLSIASQLLSKSLKIKEKWSQLEDGFFEAQLQQLPPSTKKNVLAANEVLTTLREELQQDYQEGLKAINSRFSSESFQALIANYPRDDIQKNQESNLNDLIDILMKKMMRRVDFTSPTKNWKSINNKLSQMGRQTLLKFFASSVEKYNWWNDNLPCIKTPYDQGVDHDRNQGEGTCLQNCLRRYVQLSKNSTILTKDLKMGSDRKGRISQARMNLEKQLFHKTDLNSFNKILVHHGINFKDSVIYDHLFDKPPSSLTEYDTLVEKIIQPPQNGILMLSYLDKSTQSSSQSSHVLNIQVDPKSKKYRMFDDNVGAIEFSSTNELKKKLAAYLKAFYPDYKKFSLINSSDAK